MQEHPYTPGRCWSALGRAQPLFDHLHPVSGFAVCWSGPFARAEREFKTSDNIDRSPNRVHNYPHPV